MDRGRQGGTCRSFVGFMQMGGSGRCGVRHNGEVFMDFFLWSTDWGRGLVRGHAYHANLQGGNICT